jgi:hypothetical protein
MTVNWQSKLKPWDLGLVGIVLADAQSSAYYVQMLEKKK